MLFEEDLVKLEQDNRLEINDLLDITSGLLTNCINTIKVLNKNNIDNGATYLEFHSTGSLPPETFPVRTGFNTITFEKIEEGLYDMSIIADDKHFSLTYNEDLGKINNKEDIKEALFDFAKKYKDKTYNPVELIRMALTFEFKVEDFKKRD